MSIKDLFTNIFQRNETEEFKQFKLIFERRTFNGFSAEKYADFIGKYLEQEGLIEEYNEEIREALSRGKEAADKYYKQFKYQIRGNKKFSKEELAEIDNVFNIYKYFRNFVKYDNTIEL